MADHLDDPDEVRALVQLSIDGRWQITNKTDAHTGGEPPPLG